MGVISRSLFGGDSCHVFCHMVVMYLFVDEATNISRMAASNRINIAAYFTALQSVLQEKLISLAHMTSNTLQMLLK